MKQNTQSLPLPTNQMAHATTPCLNEVVLEIANHVQAPWPLVLNTALAAMTTVTQSLIDVETPLGQVKPVSNFFVGIAESGNRKTEIDKTLTKIIKDFQIANKKRYDDVTLPAYKSAHEVWKTETTRLKRKATNPKATYNEIQEASDALATHLQREPVKPREPQLIYRDFTGPALLTGLSQKNRSAFVSSSDASGVLKGYAFRNLADLNQLWDGDTLVVNRVDNGSMQIDDSRVTIDVAVQLGPFRDFILKSDQARSTGFAARCLTCIPDSLMGGRFTQRNRLKVLPHTKIFHERVQELLELAVALEDTNGHTQRKLVTFSDQAAQQWVDWINLSIEPELRPGGHWSTVPDQASKMPEMVARLAAVITYFERGELEITLPVFYQARDIGLGYLTNYRNIWNGQVEHMKREQIKAALETWIQQHFRLIANRNYQTGQFSPIYVEKNRIRTYGPSQVRNKKVLDEALEMLSAEGKILVGPLSTFIGSRFPTQGGERTVVLPGHNLIGC